ncbi:HPP family protein [Hymenobacter sp.]|jgi:CBS-domain-containing membrane protein|uniref:HPP family protein n=1 Tax=Hymenobacter sp. TaxID=1898978 RepID=UPI002EDBA58B
MRTRLRRHARRIKVIVYQETLFDYKEHFWTFLGAFMGISIIGLLNRYLLPASDVPLLIGSFGASSVLIYGVINSPLAQPRNLLGGHVFSAIIGVTLYRLIPGEQWLAGALAVSLSIVGMQITKTLHPPGGATALIAVIGSAQLKALGYWYVLVPVLSGVLILLLIAVLVNNLTPTRHYPTNKNWYRFWQRKYQA